MFLVSAALSELFPGLYGQALRDQLKTYAYEGHIQLGYSRAREELYGYIYNDPKDQAVYCVYTGLRMACKYDSHSTGCNSDLNCEHTVPQSFFSEAEPMKSDVHHLRATWQTANSARYHWPFKQIAQADVKTWYGNNKKTTTVTPKDPENWSALDANKQVYGFWTPRDAQKGDTARAVSYFYTVYPTQAGDVTRAFPNVDEMIGWDESFPPTETQLAQHARAFEVQGNRNPFVEERGLVARAWCDKSTNYPCSKYQ